MKKLKSKSTREQLEETLDKFILDQKEINSYFECMNQCNGDQTTCEVNCKESLNS